MNLDSVALSVESTGLAMPDLEKVSAAVGIQQNPLDRTSVPTDPPAKNILPPSIKESVCG